MSLPKPNEGESQDAFINRFMVDEEAVKSHTDEGFRLTAGLNSFRENRKESLTFLKGEIGEIRVEQFEDTDHTVIPIVALVEGVLHAANSPAPELALATEFGRFPMAWNGRPVTIDHPQIRGQLVSANTPDVLEDVQVGRIFNPAIDNKKLKMEAWVNEENLNDSGAKILQEVKDGKITEVSVGVYTEVEPISGTFEEEKFNGIWRNVVPDHLALLSIGTEGACSAADGCGTNRFSKANANQPPTLMSKLLSFISFRGNKDLSDRDRVIAVQSALDAMNTGGYVVAVFDTTAIIDSYDGLFSIDFAIDDNGVISLGSDKTRVRPETEFVEVKVEIKDKDDDMDKDKVVSGLISAKSNKFTEDNREWLMGLEESNLELLGSVEVEPENTQDDDPAPQPKTLEEYISDAPVDIGRVLQIGVNQYKAAREQLITDIKANSKNKFTDAQLADMDVEMLQNVAAISGITDFTARGAPLANKAPEQEIHAPEPRRLFAKAS